MPTVVAETFQALGDPVRTTIVDRLARSDATVGDLAAMFTMSFQAVSQHIGVLERAGIVTRHREGRNRRVQLEPGRIDEALTWMESRRKSPGGAIPALGRSAGGPGRGITGH